MSLLNPMELGYEAELAACGEFVSDFRGPLPEKLTPSDGDLSEDTLEIAVDAASTEITDYEYMLSLITQHPVSDEERYLLRNTQYYADLIQNGMTLETVMKEVKRDFEDSQA